MAQITVKNLSKDFKTLKRKPGLSGAIKNLFSREYKTVNAVDKVNFSINKGELVGYIGPNGAGKSTTIKMLTGILMPSGGEITVAGRDPFKERKQNAADIGVVFGQRTSLWWDIPARESFNLLRAIYRIPDKIYNENMTLFTELLELEPFLATPVRKLSLGQKMRCEIVAALLHNPKILYLDEPTIGLDAVSKEAIRGFIKEVNKRLQTTVILTTHDLDDIEEICKRIVIIDKGQLLYDGKLASFKKKMLYSKTLLIDFRLPVKPAQIRNYLNLDQDLLAVKSEGRKKIRIDFKIRNIKAGALLEKLFQKFEIHDIVVQDEGIESIIKRVYKGEDRI